ncbi:MAG: NAD(P)/FAD-dependent oxidoreductase, partial [Hyphomonadaceae bacterium]|nr:NAD(P)/FAD-dependent oxidoreductase [Hyphomonadaceae bacterium]
YPGIRSDSDMYTLGYAFRPWLERKAIADGPAILKYVRETAADYGVDRKIRFRHRVVQAAWSSADARWTVEAVGPAGEPVRLTCGFLFMCSGYYDYDAGYTPDFPGMETFKGTFVHPQHWPQDLDYAGKKVVIIGSGATAVTLAPAMARIAGHVTMLQRSPTYVVSRPAVDPIALAFQRWLPQSWAYSATRWKNVLFGMYFFRLCRRSPDKVKAFILNQLREHLPAETVARHFTPTYNPWDQRLCLVPDADLFEAIKDERVTVVTDHIDTFTETGLLLKSGQTLDAEVIVSATGLVLKVLGGMSVIVDGAPVDFAKTTNYKGMMYSDVPNLASVFGYTNASWTLKADLTCEYVCRLLNKMEREGLRQCTPRMADPAMPREPWIDFSSGYFQRALDRFPKQGARAPWRLHQNYALDLMDLRFGSVDTEMSFTAAPARAAAPADHTTPAA